MSAFLFLKALSQDIQLWKSVIPGIKEYAIAYTPDNADPFEGRVPECFSADSDEEAERIGRQRAIDSGWAIEADFSS